MSFGSRGVETWASGGGDEGAGGGDSAKPRFLNSSGAMRFLEGVRFGSAMQST